MTQRNYLVSTTALSTTPSGTTIGSGNTTSATFALARTMVLTGIPAGELADGSLTWSIHYVVEAMTTPYEMRLKLQRLNSSGVMQTESNFGTVRSATGTFDDDITWDSGVWQANDQLALVWEHRRPSGTGSKNGTITANGSSWVDAPTLPSPSLSPSASLSPSSSVSPSLSPSASVSPSSSPSPSLSPSSSASPSSSVSPSVSPSSSQSPSSSVSPSLSPSASLSPSSSPSPSISPSSSASPSSSESPSLSPSASQSPSSSTSPSLSPSASGSPSSSESPSVSPSASESPSSSVSPSLSPSSSASPSISPSGSVSPSASLSPSESQSPSASLSPSSSTSASVSPSPPPPQPDIIYLDPGGDSVQAPGYFNTPIPGFGSDITFDTSQKVVGVGSYRFDSNTNENPAVRVAGVLGDARRVGCYFRFGSVPDVSLMEVSPADTFAEIYSGGGFADGEAIGDDDEVYATATPARNAGQGTVFGSFGFGFLGNDGGTIPLGAVIDAVKIIYERKYDTANSIGVSRVKWRVNGEEGPNHDNTDEPLTDTVVEVDVTADRVWERQDLLDTVFEVIAEARRGDTDTAHTQSWDYLKVEVTYHPANTILALANNSDGQFVQVALLPRGDAVVLQLMDVAGTFYYGITELAINTQHRISFGYAIRGTDSIDIKLYVNGIEELSIEEASIGEGTGGTLTRLHYGWLVSPGEDHVCWFDQLAIDQGDDLTDIGNVLMTAKLPATVNEDEWDTDIGTGAVNERPLNEANRKQHSLTTAARQTYTLQTAAAGDVDISGETLIGTMFWAWAKVQFDDFWDLYLVANGNDINRSAQISPTASLLRHAVTSGSYPSNAAGIGMAGSNEAPDTFLYECGAVQAYEGPLNPDILLERQLVNSETLDTIIDDLRADPPDSYEVCCTYDDFDGSVEIIIHSLDQEGGSFQQQPSLNSKGRVRIVPGIEVRLDVTVVGVTNLQIWRRINVD